MICFPVVFTFFLPLAHVIVVSAWFFILSFSSFLLSIVYKYHGSGVVAFQLYQLIPSNPPPQTPPSTLTYTFEILKTLVIIKPFFSTFSL